MQIRATTSAGGRSRCAVRQGASIGAATLILALVGGCTARHTSAADGTEGRPNVVFILMDDLGYGDLPSYGATDVAAPNIERLTREGVRLTENYASAPICSPTRAAFITGRYQARCGIEGNLVSLARDAAVGLPTSETSIARMLDTNGYATGLFGKWHLGYLPEYEPNAHGFDEYFGVLDVADYWRHETKRGVPILYDNTTEVTVPGYLTDLITDRAVSFIDHHAGREPFFVEVAYTAPHEPYQRPDNPSDVRTPANWGDGTRADYVAIIERADLGIGRILGALRRSGVDDNTLVILTSDNGATNKGSNGDLSGGKHLLREGGIRVPAILWWPGTIPAGAVSNQEAITMDLAATILAATGTRPSRPLDGIDLVPILTGAAPVEARKLFWRSTCPNAGGEEHVERWGEWKYVRATTGEELFDLATDPGELHDVSSAHADVVARMRADVAAWEADVDAAPKPVHVPCREE